MEPSPSAPRQKFGKYELLERIAVGGMAEVFRACLRGDGGFEKHLVIKRILSHLSSDSDFVVMLIDEAKIAVTLAHPNIVQIYDLGKQDGMYYIAMELIEGADVKAVLTRCAAHRMPTAHAVHVVIEVLKGLEYAHQKMGGTPQAPVPLNIIHRDVSPPNVLISYEGEVKLVDFGIAKASVRLMETSAGMLKGKFEYMSPEQARGLSVDWRTDLFSVGTVLYELLTGVNPFDGPTDLAVLKAVQRARPVPPSRHNPSIPARLEQIILKALSPEQEDRYQTAQEMRRELNAFAYAAGAISNAARLASFMREILGAEIQQGKTVHASAGGPVRQVPPGDPRATLPTPRNPGQFVPPTLPPDLGAIEEDESPTTAGVTLEELQLRTYGTVSGVFGRPDGGLTLGDFASAQDLLKKTPAAGPPVSQPVMSMLSRPQEDTDPDEFDESPTTVRELSPAELGQVPGAFPPLGARGRSSTTSLGPTAIPAVRGAIAPAQAALPQGANQYGAAQYGGARPSPPPVGSLTMHPSGIPILPGMGQGGSGSPAPRPEPRSSQAQPGRAQLPTPSQALALKPLSSEQERARREALETEGPTETEATGLSMPRAFAQPSGPGQAGRAGSGNYFAEDLRGSQSTYPQAGGAGQPQQGAHSGWDPQRPAWPAGGAAPGPTPQGQTPQGPTPQGQTPYGSAQHGSAQHGSAQHGPPPQYWAQQAGFASQPIPQTRLDQLPRPDGYRAEPPTRLDAGLSDPHRPGAETARRADSAASSHGVGAPHGGGAQVHNTGADEVTPRPGEIKPLTLGPQGVLERLSGPWRERLIWGLAGLVPGLLLAIGLTAGGGGETQRSAGAPLEVELVGQGESPFVLNDRSIEPGASRQLLLDPGASYDLRLGSGWGVRLQRIPVEGAEPLFRITVASPGGTSEVPPPAPAPAGVEEKASDAAAAPESVTPQGDIPPPSPESSPSRPE